MIRSAISLAFCLSIVSASGLARAALLAYEGFDYDDIGQDLRGKEGGMGFGRGWTGGNLIDVADGSLSFRGLQTEGNHAIMAQPLLAFGHIELSRGLSSSNGVPRDAVETRYLSFLMRPEGTVGQGGTSGFFGVLLNNRVFVGKTLGATYDLATNGDPGSALRTERRPVSGETLLFVVRADLMPGNDRFTLYLNPIPGHEPLSGTVKDDLDIRTFGSIGLQANGAFSIDEIRWGETFADVTPGPKYAVTEFIGTGEPWSFFPGREEPSPFPELAWTTSQYDDGSWQTAEEGFGYGSRVEERRKVVSLLDDMQDNYNTVYLRHSFQVEDPAAVSDVVLELDYDDGFIAYINGVEVTRTNIGAAGTPEPYDATGRQRITEGPSRFFVDLSGFADLLRPGDDNVLAIQGINRRSTDRDFVLSRISLLGLVPELTVLQAGDADQDLDFDQLDLVQVQIAGKYLTKEAATWGEGDWDGAPGGSPGNPPAGDGLFNQFDIIAAQQGAVYLTGTYAAIQPNGTSGDEQTSVVYHAGTGELSVDAPAGVELTSINIDSAGGIFTGGAAENLGGSFDNDAENNIFKATFGGSFGSLSFGDVAQPALSEEFVLNDLNVVGSLAGGGDLGNVDLVYVPEPMSVILLSVGIAIGLVHFSRVNR